MENLCYHENQGIRCGLIIDFGMRSRSPVLIASTIGCNNHWEELLLQVSVYLFTSVNYNLYKFNMLLFFF